MRPKAWRVALKRQLDEVAFLKVDATTAYRRVLEELERKDQVFRQQLEFVDKVTVRGKYNSQIAEALLPDYRHVLPPTDLTEIPAQSNAQRLRKSRAKVRITKNSVMDIMRGVCPPDSNAEVDHSLNRTIPELSLGLEQPMPASQQSDSIALHQKHPTFGSSNSGEAALEAERQEQVEKITRQNVFVSFETDVTDGLKQTSEIKISYDFSDACDETKFPPELAPLYPKFAKTRSLPVLGRVIA
jgi:hypothetical protein